MTESNSSLNDTAKQQQTAQQDAAAQFEPKVDAL
jgi:hypothetical protein